MSPPRHRGGEPGSGGPRSAPAPSREPQPLPEVLFEEWDFEALSPRHAGDREADDRRLAARRRLLSLAKTFAKGAKKAGIDLDVRTSLHNPSRFNGMAVRRLWAYITRTRPQKTRLRKVLGRELAADLDSAYRNAYLCLALEHDRLEVSLRVHPDAWYDGQNLVNRTRAEGVKGLLGRLNELSGFQLRLHDWKGEWPLGDLSPERLEEFMGYYTPGDHALVVDRRWPAPPGAREAVLGEGVGEVMLTELTRLLPLYGHVLWSAENDHLFGSGGS